MTEWEVKRLAGLLHYAFSSGLRDILPLKLFASFAGLVGHELPDGR